MSIEELERINVVNTLVKERLKRIIGIFRDRLNEIFLKVQYDRKSVTCNEDIVLTASYQHAIRILESRMRLIDREFLATYGPDDQMTAAAKLELNLACQDDGTLFKLGTYRHQQGRLFCKACDTDDDGNGNPILLARLCPACHRSIQHVYTSLKADDAVGLGIDDADSAIFVRVFTCEACAHTDKYIIAKVPVTNQDKPIDRPAITIMLNTGR